MRQLTVLTALICALLSTYTARASHVPRTCTAQRVGAGFGTHPWVRICSAPRARRARRPHAVTPRPQSSRSYTVPMLVTYYLATGSPMANGLYPSVGWAACGDEIPLGARVAVPGIGMLTCGDRIGYQPWRHIDVFGIPLGTGYRTVTVYL